ncbi:MAG: cyclopropane fatty acyl phospholipid synthase [Candidatus Kerfeldbacteria bacterium]|nr:cyclopropane fatty acyl phospholipid synthase [Candidatus Kerfeldbacteria bacterium]
MTSTPKTLIEQLLTHADIQINGSRPWDIQVKNEQLYARVLAQGSLGLGEAYMDGWWDSDALDQTFFRVFNAGLEKKIPRNMGAVLAALKSQLFNAQTPSKAFEIGDAHYNIGNDLYQAMLDKRLTYTCGYWKDAKTLDEAQEAKLDLVCRKLNLQKGQRVLDIGCGWGSFLKFAAEKYGIVGVGVTVAKEQVKLAKELCAGLPIEIRLQDYRDLNEQFDHIVSLGMFEHVGEKNYQTYMEVARRCLKDSGLFLLHTIGGNKSVKRTDAWIEKYIFPNSMLPSISQIGESIENKFVMEDWHSFGAYYDNTLMAWFENFDREWKRSPALAAQYSFRFYRMWKYYLLSCAGSFRARKNQLWQIVLSKNGVTGGYTSVR